MAAKRSTSVKSNSENHKNIGLLIIRLGLGIMFIYHGYPKLIAGKTAWIHLGSAMKYVGITFAPMLWGLLSAVVETLGGVLLIAGFVFRPVCAFMIINLIIAAAMHFGQGQGLEGAAHPIEDAITFLGLLFIGAGKYSVDKK